MRRADGHIAYHLFHGTSHIRGVEVMKQAMWKVDPGGGSKFCDRLAGQEILFSGEDVNVTPLRNALLEHFAGQTVSPSQINDFTVVNADQSRVTGIDECSSRSRRKAGSRFAGRTAGA